MSTAEPQTRLARALAVAPTAVVTAYAMAAGFSTYFCMYAFRKPFAAGTYEGADFLGTGVGLKTAMVVGQVVGYAASKFIGVKVCSEATRGRRATNLILLVLAAEAALALFAIVPPALKPLAMFLNGLPLGMVWGLVVWYLEGRRSSEVLLAGLSCSFIVASGAVKDVGRWVLHAGLASESWMPLAVGGLFLPLFGLSVWLLNQVPEPSAEDVAARTRREPMTAADRRAFALRFLPGLLPLIVVAFFLIAYRDFRDNFGVELFARLGYAGSTAVFTRSELVVALGVMGALSLLSLVRDNRLGLFLTYALMAGGMLLLGGATLLFDTGHVSGLTWMVLVGLGSYAAYVPFGSVLFDRLIARTRYVGTCVFGIYVIDAIGYTGSVGVQLFKDLGRHDVDRLSFFRQFTYGLSAGGAVLLAASGAYFLWTRGASTPDGRVAQRPIPSTLVSPRGGIA